MSKNIIVINTSPRGKGNCAAIAEHLKKMLADTGANVELVDFRTASINYCLGCNACMGHDEPWCAQKDDMSQLIGKIDACDGLVLLSPIYFGDIAAQAKTVVDRLYAFFNPTKENMTVATKFGKKVAVVTTNGSMPTEAVTQKTQAVASGCFGVAGFTESRVLAFNELNVPGAIAERESDLARIDELAAWICA